MARGQHQDRGAALAGAQPAAHGEAVEDRHHDVEDDHVRLAQRDGFERLRPVVHRLHFVALDAEREDQRLTDAAVVLGDQHPRGGFVRCHAANPTTLTRERCKTWAESFLRAVRAALQISYLGPTMGPSPPLASGHHRLAGQGSRLVTQRSRAGPLSKDEMSA